MNADFLLTYWSRLIAVPGAVSQLRRVILDLAVRGQLTADWRAANPKIEPASELLRRIQKEKFELIAAKKLRAEKPLPKITPTEISFDIPKDWEWCPLAAVMILRDGERNPISKVERDRRGKGFPYYGASGAIDEIDGFTHDGEFLLVGEDGSNLRLRSTPVAFAASGKIWVNNHAHVLEFTEPVLQEFVAHRLNGMDIDSFVTGGFQPKLSQENLNRIPIPLPPLAEQVAIVERVETLMGVCDRLEAAQRERDAMRSRYLAASYAQLAELDDDAASVDLSVILTRSVEAAQLKPLQQLILTLAIRGDLTADWRAAHPDVEPASQLLHRIQAEKARLIAAKKLRPEKPLPKITPAEIPFDIPKGWEWCRLGAIARHSLGKMLDHGKNKGTPKPYLRNLNVQWFRLVLSDLKEMRFEDHEIEKYSVQKGDIVICEGGYPGQAAIWEDDEPIMFQKALHRVRFLAQGYEPVLFVQYLKFADAAGFLKGYYTGSGIKHFTGDALHSFVLPLPPLAEQAAIVERVEALMTTCRALEAEIEHARTHAAHLLQAVLKEAFAPAS
jgi:type I restriction enzyme S subunit